MDNLSRALSESRLSGSSKRLILQMKEIWQSSRWLFSVITWSMNLDIALRTLFLSSKTASCHCLQSMNRQNSTVRSFPNSFASLRRLSHRRQSFKLSASWRCLLESWLVIWESLLVCLRKGNKSEKWQRIQFQFSLLYSSSTWRRSRPCKNRLFQLASKLLEARIWPLTSS